MSDQAERKLPKDRIPFVLAAAGHRVLAERDVPSLRTVIDKLIGRMNDRMKSTPLLLLCTLDGDADRLIADQAFECGVYLGVVLPTSQAAYLNNIKEAHLRAETARLLRCAALVIDLSSRRADEELGLCGRPFVAEALSPIGFLAMHSQALIALWDGSDAEPSDGTFEAVRSVLAGVGYENCIEPLRGTVYQIVTPCKEHKAPQNAFQINVMRCPSDLDGFLPAIPKKRSLGTSKTADKEEEREESSIKASDLEQWQLEPRGRFRKWVANFGDEHGGIAKRYCAIRWQRQSESINTEAKLVAFNADVANINVEEPPQYQSVVRDGERQYPRQLYYFFRRADGLAQLGHKRKKCFLAGILGFAFLAAVGLETHGHFFQDIPGLWFLFPSFIIIASGLRQEASRRGIEDRFLDARVLAEALRVQYFWEIGGVHKPAWQHYTAHRPMELGWVISALRGLSLSFYEDIEPDAATKRDVQRALKGWVEDQAGWYKTESLKQHKICERLERASDWILRAVVVVSLALGTLFNCDLQFAPLSKWQADLKEQVHLVGEWAWWGIAIGSVVAGILKVWLDREGYDEQARSYRRMNHLFVHRQHKIDRLLKDVLPGATRKDSEEVRRAIGELRELGTKALEENGIWLIMHREHPLKVAT